jgi:hypothetical protein
LIQVVVVEATAAIKEPQDKLRNTTVTMALRIVNRKIVVRNTNILAWNHGESPGPSELLLTSEDILDTSHVVVFVISIYGSPSHSSLDKRLQGLIEILGAVGHEIIARDNVAINNGKIYATLISENLRDNL